MRYTIPIVQYNPMCAYKIPMMPFSLDERTNPKCAIQSFFLDLIDEPYQVEPSTEIVLQANSNQTNLIHYAGQKTTNMLTHIRILCEDKQERK